MPPTTVAEPQGILVIGHTRQLVDDAQRASFHRFRRNLWNPTVLTYDELLERARFMVDKAAARAEAASGGGAGDKTAVWEPSAVDLGGANLDELPF